MYFSAKIKTRHYLYFPETHMKYLAIRESWRAQENKQCSGKYTLCHHSYTGITQYFPISQRMRKQWIPGFLFSRRQYCAQKLQYWSIIENVLSKQCLHASSNTFCELVHINLLYITSYHACSTHASR